MEPPVQLTEVWKSYGSHTAVRALSLVVPQQSVYGFLGPNGAGKSTTIRMILGLQRADRGSISLFGERVRRGGTAVLARIGSLVESPSLYAHLTGRENLEVHRRVLNVSRSAVDHALETVGLVTAGEKLVRHYSSGMKQRLGLAQALLGNPDLLLLDEPTNGLDPAGIHEIRSLIRDLPKRCSATIFLSSHILAEVEQVATHFAIISEGQLRFEGTAEELRRRNKPVIVAAVDDVRRAAALLAGAGMSVRVDEKKVLVTCDDTYGPADVNTILVRGSIAVSELVSRHLTLEDAFLELTRPAEQQEHAVVK